MKTIKIVIRKKDLPKRRSGLKVGKVFKDKKKYSRTKKHPTSVKGV